MIAWDIVLNMAHIQQLTSKETKFFMLTLSKVMRLSHQLTWNLRAFRTLKFFKDSGLRLSALVTDHHQQIQKWVRENMVGVLHYFDCWHIAKSTKKMLVSVMKKKSCNIIGSWLKSIINHYYWSVTSTEISNEDLIEAQWTSLTWHIQNIHHGHKAP